VIGALVTIKIGDTTYRGALPHMRQAFDVHAAWRSALGYVDTDTDTDTDEPAGPTHPSDGEELLLISAAAIGLCWDDKALGVPSFRRVSKRCRRLNGDSYERTDSLLEFGEHVFGALEGRHTAQEIYDTGSELVNAIVATIPTTEEVEEATDPTEALAGHSTTTTSNGG